MLALLDQQRQVLNLLEEIVAEQRHVVFKLTLHLGEALEVIIFEQGPFLDLKGEVMIEVFKEGVKFSFEVSF